MLSPLLFLVSLQYGIAQAFTIIGGQVYTPGLAIVDSPQPNTPEGGDFLQVAIDVSGDGKLSLPPYKSGFETGFHNIAVFLSSYTTGKNFTISNGTATANNASLGNILQQESGSTVKHVNWVWPDCLVGNGQNNKGESRGDYNISIRQNFRLNSTDYYTVFDLPISVTNDIESADRPSCDALNNDIISAEDVAASADSITSPFATGTGIDTSSSSTSSGLGPEKTEAGTGSSIISGAVSEKFGFGTISLLLTFYSTALLLA